MQITGATGNNNCNYITLSAKSDVGSHVHCDVGYVIKRNSIAIKSDPASFAISLPFFGTFELLSYPRRRRSYKEDDQTSCVCDRSQWKHRIGNA